MLFVCLFVCLFGGFGNARTYLSKKYYNISVRFGSEYRRLYLSSSPSTWIFFKYKYSRFSMYLSTSTSTCHCTQVQVLYMIRKIPVTDWCSRIVSSFGIYTLMITHL